MHMPFVGIMGTCSAQVFFLILVERLFTSRSTELISLAFLLRSPLRRRFVDLHPTNHIECHYEPPSINMTYSVLI